MASLSCSTMRRYPNEFSGGSEVVVMWQGKVVEQGSADKIFADPKEDYTRKLIDSVPGLGIELGAGQSLIVSHWCLGLSLLSRSSFW